MFPILAEVSTFAPASLPKVKSRRSVGPAGKPDDRRAEYSLSDMAMEAYLEGDGRASDSESNDVVRIHLTRAEAYALLERVMRSAERDDPVIAGAMLKFARAIESAL